MLDHKRIGKNYYLAEKILKNYRYMRWNLKHTLIFSNIMPSYLKLEILNISEQSYCHETNGELVEELGEAEIIRAPF